MITRSLLHAGVAVGVLTGSLTAAHAASSGVMNCNPHDWNAFAAAIEAQDNDALQAMLNDPELRKCDEIYNTVRALVCSSDPLACIEPSGGDDPDDDPNDDPGDDPNDQPRDEPDDQPDDTSPGESPFPGQRPGEPIGQESDNGNDDGGNDDGGNDDGGGGGGGGGGGRDNSPGTSTGGQSPTGSPNN